MPFQVGFLPRIFQLTWSLQRTRTDRIPLNKDWKIFVFAIAAVSFSSSSLQRKFLTDKICVEWFECIGANYSGNGEILSRNASPQNIHTAQGSKRFVFGFLPVWVKIQQDGEQIPQHVHSQTSCLSHTITKIIIVVNIVGGQMPWQRTCPEPALPQWRIPPRGAGSQICTARPPCRYHHPTCAVYFKIHFLENFKLFILRRSRSFSS